MDGLEFKPTTTYADQQIMIKICRVFMIDQRRFIEDLNVQMLCVFSLQVTVQTLLVWHIEDFGRVGHQIYSLIFAILSMNMKTDIWNT